MAEEGELCSTSINGGSDADCEFMCTPCGEDEVKEEACKYCPECQEYLCTTCARHHGRQKATRSHKLVDKCDFKHGSTVVFVTKCRYHPDRDIEMYCETHDMVYCTKCIATEHRSCSGVVNIEDFPKTDIQQNEIERLQEETTTIELQLKSINEVKQKRLIELDEMRNGILDEFMEIEKGVHDFISKLKAEATETLNKSYADIKDDLEDDVAKVTNCVAETEDSKNQLQMMNAMDATQQFLKMKLIQQSVDDAKKIYDSTKSKIVKVLCFKENTNLKPDFIKEKSLGEISVQIEDGAQALRRRYKVKSRNDVNVKMPSDTVKCFISDVCQLHDGTIIVADRYNRKLKRLDKDSLRIKDHCDLDSNPLGVCCTGQNEVAVKMNGKIQFIYVGTVFSKLRDISIESKECYGIAHIDGELWVSTGSDVIVYSTTGKVLRSIKKDSNPNDHKIFKYATQHIAVTKDTVIVTDSGDGAVCFHKNGTAAGELRDQSLKNTKGTCVSEDGVVFLAGNESDNIVMFSTDGKCLGQFVTKEMAISHPLSLCYDSKKQLVIVTQAEHSDTIRILEMND